MRRATLNLLVGVLVISGQAHAFSAQQTNSSIGDAHGREFVYPHSTLKEGQRGFYVFPRRTKLRGRIIPKGTRIVAEVARDHKGRLALFTVEPLVTSSGVVPKGTRVSFR
jgi:hypothetical protein